MSPFRKLLVPVDFSPSADEAIRVAAAMATAFGASLTVFHSCQIPVYPLPEGVVLPAASDLGAVLAAARTQVEREGALARALGVAGVDEAVAEGPAAAEIVRVAREGGYDLIVMGTHGRTGFRHLLLGSVAEKVVRTAPCAVLTVHAPELQASKVA